jgi:hypothetical protein
MDNEAEDSAKRSTDSARTFLYLTLADVARMSVHRELDGWYVAPCDTTWTIGRRSGGEHCLVVVNAKPVSFDSMGKATRYLRALLSPTVTDPSPGPLNLRVELAPHG